MKATLQALYDKLPKLECQGKCQQSCGPIDCSPIERRTIQEFCQANKIKFFTFQKATLQRVKQLMEMDDACLMCPYLKNNKCIIYPVRPMICRLWGLVESMPCEWGCKPQIILSDIQGRQFLDEVEWLK